MVKFKDFSRPLSVFQVLFKANCIFKDFSRQSCIFQYFSSLCEPCIQLKTDFLMIWLGNFLLRLEAKRVKEIKIILLRCKDLFNQMLTYLFLGVAF